MELYGFDERDVARIAAMLAAFEDGRLNTVAPPARGILPAPVETRLARVGGSDVGPVALTATTVASSVASGSHAVTPASMANINVGTTLTVGVLGDAQENVVVTATTLTTFTAVFTVSHTGPFAVSGTTPGSATVELWSFNVASGNVADTGQSAVAYNAWDYAVPANTFVPIAREPISGAWFVVPPPSLVTSKFDGVTDTVVVPKTAVLDVQTSNGLTVSGPGSGVAALDIVAATTVAAGGFDHAGVVSTTMQSFAGSKHFEAGVIVGSATNDPDDETGQYVTWMSGNATMGYIKSHTQSGAGPNPVEYMEWGVGPSPTASLAIWVSGTPFIATGAPVVLLTAATGYPCFAVVDPASVQHTGTWTDDGQFAGGLFVGPHTTAMGTLVNGTTAITGGTNGDFLYQGSGKVQEVAPGDLAISGSTIQVTALHIGSPSANDILYYTGSAWAPGSGLSGGTW